MALNVAQKLIRSHLSDGEMVPGAEIALRVDQVLLQDVLGTLVMLELEALGLRLYTQVLGWPYEELQALLVDVRKDIQNPAYQMFSTM